MTRSQHEDLRCTAGREREPHPDRRGPPPARRDPPGGKCDIKALALKAGIDRAAFYGSRPYARLREGFEARLAAAVQDGDVPDPRDAGLAG